MEQTDVVEQPAETVVTDDSGGSLSDHEASYAPGAVRADPTDSDPADTEPAEKPDASARERDETGKFTKVDTKPRHRAKSQQASPDDAPRIAALTRKLRETEERHAAERAEWERRHAPRDDRREPERQPDPPKRERFPSFDAWVTKQGKQEQMNDPAALMALWDDYDDAKYDWRRWSERAAEAAAADHRSFSETLSKFKSEIPTVRQEFPDYDDVIAAAPNVSRVIERAVIEVGPRAAYWLATHADERDALTDDTVDLDGAPPNHPAFKAAVATTRRYLSSLVASEQRSSQSSSSSSRTAAGSTGAALALVSQTAPKPPTPVRTGAMRQPDALPGDDSSLADHMRAFSPKSRHA